ncbi:MAG: recombinase family protein [Lachnospiraceae bacterium]|nr:recombinase family protein [Lachnospiraceae bacterium]
MSLNRNIQSKVYRTAIYLRLSKEDGDKAESDSIANQRTLISDFIRGKEEFCVVEEYVDDGYTGSNFERPAFQQLYEDLESGAVNCVIVKDLSRFGRNYIEVGRYLERSFPLLGVRLIAINDNYDGASEWTTNDAIIVPIKNLMNDAYCRDMSIKIKSQLEAKRKRGDYVGNYTVYGYKKNPKKNSELIIDEQAAEIVRRIFVWKLEGMSNQGIADRLNAMGVLSPLEYKLSNGSNISENFKQNEQARWSAKAVFRIIHDEVYIGNLAQGKSKKLDYRSKNITVMPEDKWVRVEETHEPIIDKTQFDLVQSIVEKDTRIAPGKDSVMIFSGYIDCGDCHNKLVRRSSSYKGKKYAYYICNGYKQEHSCTTHNISHQKLYEVVLNAVQHQVELAAKTDKILDEIKSLPLQRKRVVQLDTQIVQLQEELERYKRIKQKLYEDYTEGILNRDEYLEYTDMYAKKIDVRLLSMKEISSQRKEALADNVDSKWITSFKRYKNIKELTRPVVIELIDRIYVYEGGKIEIHFQFQDAMDEMVQFLKEAEEKEKEKKTG